MCLSWCCICIDETGKIKCSKEECRKVKCKRYFLPFVVISSLAFFEEFREFYYFPFIISVAFFIIFWNFPILVYVTASKPLFYEDLFIDEKKLPNYDVDPKIKKKFQSQKINKFIEEIYWRIYWKGWMENRPKVWCNFISEKNYEYDFETYQKAINGNSELDFLN